MGWQRVVLGGAGGTLGVDDYDGLLAELGKAVVPLYLGEARGEGLPCLIACSDSRLLAWDLQLHL